MKRTKRILALAIAACMILACAVPALAAESMFTTEVTADGWIKVTQEGGPTLGYSPDSGVKLIEEDGYAFKDLNKNGALDIYEDWREDYSVRAEDLASKMSLSEQISMVLYDDIKLNADGEGVNNSGRSVLDILESGTRSFLAFSTSLDTAAYVNEAQAYAEGTDLGIPLNYASNPMTFGGPGNLAIGATFDPALANEIGQTLSRIYRAIGVATELGPEIEIASEPRWVRVSGTYGEDPALSRDIANGIISGYQSTYDEDGNDLGWGPDSVIGMMKHFPGDGAGEGGRESHSDAGAYEVYPGGQFATSLIPFFDGALQLDSKTGESAAVMLNMSISFAEDERYGPLVATPYARERVDILRENGYDGVICTDWLASRFAHGVKLGTTTEAENIATILMNGVDQIGCATDLDLATEAYNIIAGKLGQEAADEMFYNIARRVVRTFFYAGLFENPYLELDKAEAALNSTEYQAFLREANLKSIVMLKNENGAIGPKSGDGKPTVYIPMLFTSGAWALPVDLETAEQYFNVVTDTLGEPTGEASGEASGDASGDASGETSAEPAYTENDIIRASAEELAACDFALVIVRSPVNTTGYSGGEYIPITMQYREYRADSEGVRSESISGSYIESTLETPYGVQTIVEKENRSYYGKTNTSKYESDLDAILYAGETMPEDKPVIVAVNASSAFCVDEFEPAADAILVGYGIDNALFLEIAAGNFEPNGLLPVQMPADMAAVEAQLEDVPRDTACYVDAAGNTYDFAFGMNWSGVISDGRVAAYSVPALVDPATVTVDFDS